MNKTLDNYDKEFKKSVRKFNSDYGLMVTFSSDEGIKKKENNNG